MGSWHLWSVACAETSVESSDHEQYRKLARIRGDVCISLLIPSLFTPRFPRLDFYKLL
jgi:hypothetical protein